MSNQTIFDVLIIGAGASGLACAQRLREAGKKVLVLEARNRIGGRVHTIRERGVVEAGAEFVHGEHATTWEIIRADQLETEEWHYDSLPSHHRHFGEGGQIRSDTEKLLRDMQKTQEGLYDFVGDEISIAEYLDRQTVTPEATFFAKRHIGDIESADAELLSATTLAHESSLATNGDRNFWVTNGYDAVIHRLAHNVSILLSHVVTEITWDAREVSLRCENGAHFTAEKLVITIPVGVMRSNPPKFTPPLPHTFIRAFEKVGFGNSTKLTLWLAEGANLPEFLIIDTKGMFGHFWPRLFGSEPVLVGFSGGSRADALTEMKEPAAIRVGVEDIVDALGNEIRSSIVHARHFTWSDDPYACGSYSYSPLRMGSARDDLREPIANTIFYTGEATNEHGHTATVHGAIESGRDTATKILELLIPQ